MRTKLSLLIRVHVMTGFECSLDDTLEDGQKVSLASPLTLG